MKKTLSLLLVGLLVLGMTVNVFALDASEIPDNKNFKPIEELAPDDLADMFGDSYPYSVDYEWPPVKDGEIIKGTVVASYDENGSHCWNNGTDNASCAFDGDTVSFFDPYTGGNGEHTYSWCGLLLDQPYELTEIRICNRSGQEKRISGAAIQGSNDNGETWHNIVYVDPAIYGKSGLLTNDYHVFTPEPVQEYIDANLQYMDESLADFSVYWVGTGSYSLYRYVAIESEHGDCAEIELYGHPKAAYVGEEKQIVTAEKSDAEHYVDAIDYVGTPNVTADGSVSGKVIGGGGAWSDTASYENAWDGDGATYYDPAAAGPACWTGILADQATVLTEVRVMPRVDWNDRTAGAAIQGSNNGTEWTTLAFYDKADCLASDAGQEYISKTVEGAAAYWMFRYVSIGYEAGTDAEGNAYDGGTSHGDVGDILLFGTAGEATLEYEAPAAAAGDLLKCDGKEYDEAAAAAKGIGSKPITAYEFVEGADIHFGNEGPENLWDDDVTTKFCTDGFPAWSVAQVDGKYSINGIIMATANDNSSNPGRAPGQWTIYGSNDNAGWDVIATGDDTFFTEVAGDVDYTFFAAAIEPTAAYSYFKFECTGTPINLMQVSEVVLCSADAPEAAAPVEEKVEEVKEEVAEAVEEVKEDVTEAAEAVGEAVSEAANDAANAVTDAANNAVESAKSGCGSFIGGGLIVLVTLLGSAWISRRK
ncbi:MAG: discoidin domain-containing protein [Clostridia bacterium]|nr:discoidin domain-containing protein [Clostridia bacterium]